MKPEKILRSHLKKQGMQEMVQHGRAFESTIVDAMVEFTRRSNETKMVFVHIYGTCEGDAGEEVIPFDLVGEKDDFVLAVLDMVKEVRKQGDNYVQMFGSYVNVEYAENIEHHIHTLDEWFQRNKLKIDRRC